MERFDGHGRLVIPDSKIGKLSKEYKEPWVIGHAYCSNGHSLINKDHIVNGYPGIHLAFRRGNERGEFVVSAKAGDLDKIIISGELVPGLSYDLSCPHCHVKLPVLLPCGCSQDGRLLIIGLTPQLNYHNAITLCNVAGCTNSSIVSSDEIIRHIRVDQGG